MTVTIQFLPDNVTVEAQPGEALLTVAHRAGVQIPTGCLMGSCHACEVDIVGGESLCACIASVPPKPSQLTIQLYTDPTWA